MSAIGTISKQDLIAAIKETIITNGLVSGKVNNKEAEKIAKGLVKELAKTINI